jgi:AcrR family transcriptional regulator
MTDPAPELRDRLLDAAHELLATEGWSRTTMADVGKRAGVSRQTVYNEIGNRSDLAEALVARELQRFLAVVSAALAAGGTLSEAVGDAARRVLEMAAGNELLHAVVSSALGSQEDLLPLLTTRSQPLITAAVAAVTAGVVANFPQQAPQADQLDRAANAVVRLVLSHIMQPQPDPSAGADEVAWVAARLLDR